MHVAQNCELLYGLLRGVYLCICVSVCLCVCVQNCVIIVRTEHGTVCSKGGSDSVSEFGGEWSDERGQWDPQVISIFVFVFFFVFVFVFVSKNDWHKPKPKACS